MLVDTSVWIDHFRRSHLALVAALDRGDVECHEFVLGELACGSLPRRDVVLTLMQTLPRIAAVSTLVGGTRLWTLDRRLERVAQDLGVAWEPSAER